MKKKIVLVAMLLFVVGLFVSCAKPENPFPGTMWKYVSSTSNRVQQIQFTEDQIGYYHSDNKGLSFYYVPLTDVLDYKLKEEGLIQVKFLFSWADCPYTLDGDTLTIDFTDLDATIYGGNWTYTKTDTAWDKY